MPEPKIKISINGLEGVGTRSCVWVPELNRYAYVIVPSQDDVKLLEKLESNEQRNPSL